MRYFLLEIYQKGKYVGTYCCLAETVGIAEKEAEKTILVARPYTLNPMNLHTHGWTTPVEAALKLEVLGDTLVQAPPKDLYNAVSEIADREAPDCPNSLCKSSNTVLAGDIKAADLSPARGEPFRCNACGEKWLGQWKEEKIKPGPIEQVPISEITWLHDEVSSMLDAADRECPPSLWPGLRESRDRLQAIKRILQQEID